MASPLLLLGCAGSQSAGRRIYPQTLWVLALRVSPTHYRIYDLSSSTGTSSGRVVSIDEFSHSLRPTSGYVVGHIPASEASTIEQDLWSLAVLINTTITPTLTSTISQDEQSFFLSRNVRWPKFLQSLRHMSNNSHGIPDTQREMREAVLGRCTEQWNSRTSSSSFIDWLATITIDTTDSDSDVV